MAPLKSWNRAREGKVPAAARASVRPRGEANG
jgi:hypothetical protein